MKKLFWLIGTIAVSIGIFTLCYQFFGWSFLGKHFLFWPRLGWKKINGCVAYQGKEINYQFFAHKDWYLVTPDMGCGRKYPDAESWGLEDQQIGQEVSDVTQIALALYDVAPSNFDSNSVEYFDVPGFQNEYLEFMRITVHDGAMTFKISDKEWKYIRYSFKFKK